MTTTPILLWALDIAAAAVALAIVLCAWRLVRGPDPTDRILAVDTLYINVVALVVFQLIFTASSAAAMLRPRRC